MDVFENSKAILNESRDNAVKDLTEHGVDHTTQHGTDDLTPKQAYWLGCLRALDLGIAVIDGAKRRIDEMPDVEESFSSVLRKAFTSVLVSAKDNFADALENVSWTIKDIDL